jgi:hypothetical protein
MFTQAEKLKMIRLAMLKKQAKNLPKEVEEKAKLLIDKGYDVGKAWAVSWSIYCKYTNPKSDHCHMRPSQYFKGRKKKKV